MTKLLQTGRTDLLRGFVSARTRRKFSAYLVRGADGKVGFEFEARAAKKSTGAKPASTSSEAESSAPASKSNAPARKRASAK